jgi:monomeric archaeal DNA polymerase sliding clamp
MAVVGVGSVKLTYPDGKEWYLIMDAVAVLVEESTLTLTKDGVKLRALDPSRTAMVDLYMPRTAFDEYPDVDQDVNIGINFGEIKKILRRAGKGSSVSFEVEENSLKIRMTGKVTRTVKLPLIDVPVEQLPTPKVVFTVTAKLASDALRQAVKDVEVIADAAKFEGKEDGLYIRASSDRGETEIKFERGWGGAL